MLDRCAALQDAISSLTERVDTLQQKLDLLHDWVAAMRQMQIENACSPAGGPGSALTAISPLGAILLPAFGAPRQHGQVTSGPNRGSYGPLAASARVGNSGDRAGAACARAGASPPGARRATSQYARRRRRGRPDRTHKRLPHLA